MVALPLSVLALAAGVYLLVKVKREFLGGIFGILAWLVIVLSLAAVGFTGYKAVFRCDGGSCNMKRECHVEKRVMMHGDKGHGGGHMKGMGDGCAMHGCKIEGDSCIMSREACEEMMGKEACEKMINERGRCIMGKDECRQMCSDKGIPCCFDNPHGGGAMKSCSGGKKKCCKMDVEE